MVWSAQCVIDRDKESCQRLHTLTDQSLSTREQHWLSFLATRRDTFIVPTANCLGHKLHKRQEGSIDPNRDFAYSRRDARCFLSSTARVFHELARDNILQVVVTFHAGMVALGYEWGSGNHPRPQDRSPDEQANRQIAGLMRTFAGGFGREKPYPGKYITGFSHVYVTFDFTPCNVSGANQFVDISCRRRDGRLAVCRWVGLGVSSKNLSGIESK
jgi:hypothetical protein